MSTTEVGQTLGIPTSTIRYHISRGNLTPPRKDKRGKYSWKERDVNRLVRLMTNSARS